MAFASTARADMRGPRITRSSVDWSAATPALPFVPPGPDAIAGLSAATGEAVPGVARSPVPVLLPFDLDGYLADRAAGHVETGPAAYSFGFAAALFAPGPAGYDAVIPVKPSDLFPDIAFAGSRDFVIAASILTYELDPPVPAAGAPVPSLEPLFPGIRRLLLEHHVRYTFMRYGVPYVVSAECFEGPSRKRRLSCRDADRVMLRLLASLRMIGGTPDWVTPPPLPPTARPDRPAADFAYHPVGQLLPGTGFRKQDGRADDTVYAAIRFPLAQPPAELRSQYFRRPDPAPPAVTVWRDNFCERRGFMVGQCPAGLGHQGEDIIADCHPESGNRRDCPLGFDHVVAVRDGAIMRAPGQEAAYLIVNTATEHIRFRYLHMRPRLLDDLGVVSGRVVRAGELLGKIGNFDNRENGTSYHLHFDIQVPTRAGWVFVSPYMTLVAAYERLIDGRGNELQEPAPSCPAPKLLNALALADIHHAILVMNDANPPRDGTSARTTIQADLACPATVSRRHLRHGCGAGLAGPRHGGAKLRTMGRGVPRQGVGARHLRRDLYARDVGAKTRHKRL